MLKVNIIKCGFESLKMFGFFAISQKQHEKNYIYMKLNYTKNAEHYNIQQNRRIVCTSKMILDRLHNRTKI